MDPNPLDADEVLVMIEGRDGGPAVFYHCGRPSAASLNWTPDDCVAACIAMPTHHSNPHSIVVDCPFSILTESARKGHKFFETAFGIVSTYLYSLYQGSTRFEVPVIINLLNLLHSRSIRVPGTFCVFQDRNKLTNVPLSLAGCSNMESPQFDSAHGHRIRFSMLSNLSLASPARGYPIGLASQMSQHVVCRAVELSLSCPHGHLSSSRIQGEALAEG